MQAVLPRRTCPEACRVPRSRLRPVRPLALHPQALVQHARDPLRSPRWDRLHTATSSARMHPPSGMRSSAKITASIWCGLGSMRPRVRALASSVEPRLLDPEAPRARVSPRPRQRHSPRLPRGHTAHPRRRASLWWPARRVAPSPVAMGRAPAPGFHLTYRLQPAPGT